MLAARRHVDLYLGYEAAERLSSDQKLPINTTRSLLNIKPARRSAKSLDSAFSALDAFDASTTTDSSTATNAKGNRAHPAPKLRLGGLFFLGQLESVPMRDRHRPHWENTSCHHLHN
jgi:hypothetical protein